MEVVTLEVGTKMCVTVAAGVTVVTARAWQSPEGERRSWERGSTGEGEEEGATEAAGVAAMLAWFPVFTVILVAVG